ncbi:MAG: heterodisulfide reductase subunit C [Candidatus Eisenbacteria bacterium]|nr:heterodisulfide reductase subunit C [Candidatus Eisenbacteria bacterium]
MEVPSAVLRDLVAEATGQRAFRCYQCGNCSAGCPMAGKGDMLPHLVFRLLQLGDDSPVRSIQPWLCVGCQTCAVRCPQDLDLSLVMDALRAEAMRRGTVPDEAKRIAAFNKIFLEQILDGGRLSEVQLGAIYNLRTLAPFQNLTSVPALLRRGKIRIGGKAVRGPGAARRGGGKP